ncbi:MAG: tetratricopeptide repeat protein, partial [Deltaproteobacteria bacterium]|nr:tetratricopeptide repeat protein [Deltaproteobacteria bacterium]
MQHRFKASWRLNFMFPLGGSDLPGYGLYKAGDFVGAEAEARAALKDAVRGHGSGCAEALPFLDLLGAILAKDGREEGEAFISEARDITYRHLGVRDQAAYDRLQNLGFLELCLGRPRKALEHFRQVGNAWEGGAHREQEYLISALGARSLEAVALAETGREGEACALLEEVVPALESVEPGPKTRRDGFLVTARENLRLARDLVRLGGPAPNDWVAQPGGGSVSARIFHWSWDETGTGQDDPAREMRDAGDMAGAEAKALEALALLPGPGAPGRERALPLLDSLGLTLVMACRPAEAL